MASELTGFGKFCKWIALPAVLFVVGRYAIGPRIGGLGEKIPQVRKIGQIAREIGGKETPAPKNETTPKSAEPLPSSTGATEFQRIREADEVPVPPKPVKRKTHRKPVRGDPTPIDQVGNE